MNNFGAMAYLLWWVNTLLMGEYYAYSNTVFGGEKHWRFFFIKPPKYKLAPIFPSSQYSKLYYKQYSLLQISVPLFTKICSCRLYINPQSTEKLSYKRWRPKGVFQFEIIINALVSSFCFI